MRIYGKSLINEKSTSSTTTTDRIHHKKKNNKIKSLEMDEQQFLQLTEEQNSNNEYYKKALGNKKQLSVNKEYKRISPNYNNIYEKNYGKHSFSTSKNYVYKFNKEDNEDENNDDSDEGLLFMASNNIVDNKIKNSSQRNKNKKSENDYDNMSKIKNKKIIYKSRIKSKNLFCDKLKSIIKNLSSTNYKMKIYF